MHKENKSYPEQDIPSLIKKNQQLTKIIEEKETIFNEILEASMAGYWDWHIQEDYEYMSPSFKSMFGYKEDELPNHPVRSLWFARWFATPAGEANSRPVGGQRTGPQTSYVPLSDEYPPVPHARP